jgi:hypothetical protein
MDMQFESNHNNTNLNPAMIAKGWTMMEPLKLE